MWAMSDNTANWFPCVYYLHSWEKVPMMRTMLNFFFLPMINTWLCLFAVDPRLSRISIWRRKWKLPNFSYWSLTLWLHRSQISEGYPAVYFETTSTKIATNCVLNALNSIGDESFISHNSKGRCMAVDTCLDQETPRYLFGAIYQQSTMMGRQLWSNSNKGHSYWDLAV